MSLGTSLPVTRSERRSQWKISLARYCSLRQLGFAPSNDPPVVQQDKLTSQLIVYYVFEM